MTSFNVLTDAWIPLDDGAGRVSHASYVELMTGDRDAADLVHPRTELQLAGAGPGNPRAEFQLAGARSGNPRADSRSAANPARTRAGLFPTV